MVFTRVERGRKRPVECGINFYLFLLFPNTQSVYWLVDITFYIQKKSAYFFRV